MKKRILILDFDGVICDSIDECFLVAYNAYLNFRRKKKGMVFRAPQELKDYFSRNRHWVRPAREYFVIFKHFKPGIKKIISGGNFKALTLKYRSDSLKFAKEFYAIRDDLRRRHLKKWFSLNRIYPLAIQAIKVLRRDYKIYISTTKDRKSATMLLSRRGIRLADRAIFSKENNYSKEKTARLILKKNKISPKDAWFLDDNIMYLNEVSSVGINCALAKWGYLSNGALWAARIKGYPVFSDFNQAKEFLAKRRYS